jgi:hypothetical protein
MKPPTLVALGRRSLAHKHGVFCEVGPDIQEGYVLVCEMISLVLKLYNNKNHKVVVRLTGPS